MGKFGEFLDSHKYVKAAANAVSHTLTSYAGSKIAGIDTEFSWKSVAASAVTAVVTQGITDKLGDTEWFSKMNPKVQEFALGAMGGAVNLHVRRAFGFDDKVDYGQVVADAFGNVVGNTIADKLISEMGLDRNQARAEPDKLVRLPDGGALHADGTVTYGIFKPMTPEELAAFESTEETPVTESTDGASTGGMGAVELEPTMQTVSMQFDANGKPILPHKLTALEQLDRLRDPAILKDPKALREIYSSVHNFSSSLINGLSPEERAAATTMIYTEIFKKDPSAVWFGLAPYATSKVGETYGLLEFNVWAGSDNAQILRKGFYEGNGAIFESMFTAELIYRAGGTNAIRAVDSLGEDMFGANYAVAGRGYRNSLVKSFELRDQAKAAFAQGNRQAGIKFLTASLYNSADFEQRVVLQQYYDRIYYAGDSAKTLRAAINDFGKADIGYMSPRMEDIRGAFNGVVSFASNQMTNVTIGGERYHFTGDDVGDPNQRMPFVYHLGGNLMKLYASKGPGAVHDDQRAVAVKVFDPTTWDELRKRYGF
jgi:hypothetical protein